MQSWWLNHTSRVVVENHSRLEGFLHWTAIDNVIISRPRTISIFPVVVGHPLLPMSLQLHNSTIACDSNAGALSLRRRSKVEVAQIVAKAVCTSSTN